jgi:glycosyltransferase involved in cell wall biosynthesis
MIVCVFGTFDQEHLRTRVLLRALAGQGHEVTLCHVPLWTDTADKVRQARKGLLNPRLWWRYLRAYSHLLAQGLRAPRFDALLVPYGGFLDAYVAGLVCGLRRKPLLVDALISVHETVVRDRALLAPGSMQARLIQGAERLGLRLASAVIVDTEENAAFMARSYGLPPERLYVIPVGCDEADYHPGPVAPDESQAAPGEAATEVVFYGKFIPLHGIDLILRAVALLAGEPGIHFTFYGDGQTYDEMRALADELGLTRISWHPQWLPAPELAQRIAGADVCLGIFGPSDKAARVIPTKAYVALAMGKPLVTMGSPTAQRVLRHGETAMLSTPGDAASLAACLLALHQDRELRDRIGANGYCLFQREYSTAAIGARLAPVLAAITARPATRRPR